MRTALAALLPFAAWSAAASAQAEEVAEAQWNGLTVSAQGYGKEAALLFTRSGRVVHSERDETAHRWFVAEPRDLDGDGRADLHAWFWSGGAHCCITHIVFPATMGDRPKQPAKAWRLKQGDGDPSGFEQLEGYPRPLMRTIDSSSAYLAGAFTETAFFPYVVEIGPAGFQLAEPLMRASRRGEGPDALRDGPAAWRTFLLTSRFGGPSELADLPTPAERTAEIRRLIAARTAGHDARTGRYLPLVERHIKAHCVYDAACDIRALARELEGDRRGVLSDYVRELERSWKSAPVRLLKDKRQPG